MILSFNTLLLSQSLSDKNDNINSLFATDEANAVESGENSAVLLPDSTQNSTPKIRELKEISDNEDFRLKSKSGVFSFFNEIVFYWFHQV